LGDGQCSEDRVVDWEALGVGVMGHLVKGALDHLVLRDLLEALEAEGVAAREREGLLLVVVVLLEAHPAFKYRVHLIIRINKED
jgi:hypothetical protein